MATNEEVPVGGATTEDTNDGTPQAPGEASEDVKEEGVMHVEEAVTQENQEASQNDETDGVAEPAATSEATTCADVEMPNSESTEESKREDQTDGTLAPSGMGSANEGNEGASVETENANEGAGVQMEKSEATEASKQEVENVTEGATAETDGSEAIEHTKEPEEKPLAAPPTPYVEPPAPIETDAEKQRIIDAEKRLETLKWSWEQTEKALTIRITLPENVVTRSLNVVIKKKELVVQIAGAPFVSWQLFGPVVVMGEDDPQWTVTSAKDGSKVLEFDLPKVDAGMWHFLIKQKMPSTYFFSPDEVAKMWEEDRAGLPPKPVTNEDPSLVFGPDGIKLNPEIEESSKADEALTAMQLYQKGLTCFRQGSTEFNEGLRMLRVCALKHDLVEASLFLFEVYAGDTFYGVPKDFPKGFWFLRTAADKTQDHRCYLTLASHYEHGLLGLPASFGQAVKYYQKAASQGQATAMSHLADMLMRGKCINAQAVAKEERKRPDMAKALLEAAQRRGCPQSYVTMGDFMLQDFPGFPRDLVKAEACYEKAKALYPDLKAAIPMKELAAMKRAEAEAKNPKTLEPEEVPAATPATEKAIETAMAKAKQQQERAMQERLKKLEGQLTKHTTDAPEPNAPAAGSMFGPGFWEKVGTVAASCALGLWLLTLNAGGPGGRR
jgi:TPR repeat protein